MSFGTEGRRPDDEVPPSDNVYEYIVFRGSDVKDLRIEETPNENKATKPQIPDDPAILGVSEKSSSVWKGFDIINTFCKACDEALRMNFSHNLRERKIHVDISVAFLLMLCFFSIWFNA